MYNRVILVGRICTDPELKYTASGVAVANFRIAVDRPFTSSQGERETDFLDIVTWRQQAEFVNRYCGKGRLILVEGRLQARQYMTKDNERRRVVEVVADTVRGLERGRDQRDGDAPPPPTPPPARSGGGQAREEYGASEPPPDFDTGPDSIVDPFADQ